MTKSPSFARLDGLQFDVAIIGAGINGASAAQHLSAAGYRVLVVDQGDFANGASSRSSRLLHCGLRHLASGSNFLDSLLRPGRLLRTLATARDDMLARDELVRDIPQRLKPIHFCLPIYADDNYSPWQMDLAFATLRGLSPRGASLDYRRYDPRNLDAVPIAGWLRDRDRLKSVAVFREYLFDWPERIALDALFDARRLGARVHNYTRVESLQALAPQPGWRLSLRQTDAAAGSAQSGPGQTAGVTARLVLNLAGAWVDGIVQKAGQQIEPMCSGIKGVHIALRLPREFSDWGLFAYNSIGEPLYCLPANGMHYIGLTRTPFEGDIDQVAASDQEIDWMIAETRRCLPQLPISRADILFSWAGVNPLSRDPGNPLGSREIRIYDLASDGLADMLALTGGPIVTHRRVARRLLRAVSKRLPPSTAPRPAIFQHEDHAPEQDDVQIESAAFGVSYAAVRRCAREEQCANLADLLMRRLGAGWASDQGLELARAVAEAAAPELGWSETRIDDELHAYRQHLKLARRRPGS
jgi:glycerol-3-phosphate dehydrogenase